MVVRTNIAVRAGLLLLFLLGNVVPVAAQVVINEAMINEPGGYQSLEWIELYSTSDTAVSLSDLDLQVDGSSLELPQAQLEPGEYLVLCRKLESGDGTASFEGRWGDSSGVWGDVPSEIAIQQPLEVSMKLLNDAGTIRLSWKDQIISELTWSDAGPDGISLERTQPESDEILLCRSYDGSTPGYINSNTPVANDLSIHNVMATARDGWCDLQVSVVNFGTDVSSEVILQVLYAADSILLDQYVIAELWPDSQVTIEHSYLLSGMRRELSLILPSDDRTENNRQDLWVPGEEFPPVMLSEVMPNPRGNSDAEWVEIRYVGSVPTDLNGWQLGDSKKLCCISDSSLVVEPGERLVLARDRLAFYDEFGQSWVPLEPTCWPILNNTVDTVRLVDPYGIEADRFVYSTVFTDNYCWSRSEDISEGEWGRSTVPGGTPGLENEVVLLNQTGAMKLSIAPKVFSPDGDGMDDSTVISVSPVLDDLTVRIFDRQGRVVREFDHYQTMTGSMVWHGFSDGGSTLPIGIYIVLVTGGDDEALKQAVVVAR